MSWPMNSLVIVLSILVVFLSLFVFICWDDPQNLVCNHTMAEQSEDLQEKFRMQNKSAFVLGYTGEVGKEIVKALLTSRIFSKVVLIGRRTVEYNDDLYKDVEQRVIDFEKIEDYADAFKNFDVGYSSLGTTRGKAGATGFYRVDHDYVVNSAKLARDGGCKQLHLISSGGADHKSSFLYIKTKGEVEEELKAMGFESLYIYRPGLLLCDRVESRPMEKVTRALFKPIAWGFPTALSIPTSTVGLAAVNRTVTPSDKPVELLDNKTIHLWGKDCKKPTK